jgi:hypothetical protein
MQLEIQWYKKQDIAYIENDAIGYYHQILNPVILLLLWHLGIPAATISSLSKTWEQMVHRIKTMYGVSNSSYSNNPEYFLFGPGQASTIGPILWLLCFILIHQSLVAGTPGMSFTSANTTITVIIIIIKF